MSGVKRTTVTMYADEADRLRKQARNASDISRQNNILQQMNASLTSALRQSEAQVNGLQNIVSGMNNRVAAMQAAQSKETQALRSQLNQTVRDSNARIQAQAAETSRRMREMQTDFSNQLRTAVADIADTIEANNQELNSRIQQTENSLRADIKASHDSLQAQIDGVEAEINRIHASDATLLNMAREYHQTAEALNAETPNYVHGVEMLGGMEEVLHSSETACSDIRLAEKLPANSSVARASARSAYEMALEFQQRAAAAENRWQLCALETRQTLDAVAAQLEASRVLSLEDGPEVDVDHWSNGGLATLEARLVQVRGALDASTAQTTVEDLDGLRQAAEQISREIGQTAEFAALAIQESQNRADTAADFSDRLNELGVNVVDYGYEGRDQRCSYRLHAKDPVSGDEFYIVQRPEIADDGTIVTVVETDYCSDTPDEALFQDRQRAMQEAMGLSEDVYHAQTAVETVPGYETKPSDRAMPSAEAWTSPLADTNKIPTPPRGARRGINAAPEVQTAKGCAH